MKILHLLSTNTFSGAENVACQIIKNSSKEYDMIYCCPRGDIGEKIKNEKINYLELKKLNYKSIKKAIELFKPDIIHAHDIKASIYATLFYKKAKIISHIHNNHENMRKRNLKTILYNHFSKHADKIIWVSESAYNDYYYKDKIENKSIIIENVINSEDILIKIKKDKKKYADFDIIYIGRLSYQKDPIRLINVISLIKNKKNTIKVAIVGKGELEEEVIKKIKELGLKENIRLFGFVSNPYKILSKSKILILTSRFEGTPMVALEAMAIGKPIVSTPTDGLVELIDNNKTGYLSDKDNDLCEKCLELITNEKKYKEMKNNVINKNNILNDIKKYIEKIEKIYKE